MGNPVYTYIEPLEPFLRFFTAAPGMDRNRSRITAVSKCVGRKCTAARIGKGTKNTMARMGSGAKSTMAWICLGARLDKEQMKQRANYVHSHRAILLAL